MSHYHKPPDVAWSPGAIADQLLSLGLSARSDGQRVTIEVALPAEDTDIGKTLRELLPKSTGTFSIDLSYRSDRFIRNIVIKHDINLMYVNFPDAIHRVLKEQGLLLVSHDSEFSIARKVSQQHAAIDELEAEIKQLEQTKMDLVHRQDYVAAAKVLELQRISRDRLDSLVVAERINLAWCMRDCS